MVFFSNNRLSFAHPTSQAATAVSNLTSDAIAPTRQALLRRQRASDKGGNTVAAATLIPTPGKKRIVDTVSRRDVDIFKLVITTPSNVRFNVKNRSDAALVGSILDSQGQVLSYEGTPLTGTIQPDRRINNLYSNIQPGTYYVRVATRSRESEQYELKLTVVDPAAPVDCGCGS
jgi:hypothetical protein